MDLGVLLFQELPVLPFARFRCHGTERFAKATLHALYGA